MWDFVIEDKKPVKSDDKTAAAFEERETAFNPKNVVAERIISNSIEESEIDYIMWERLWNVEDGFQASFLWRIKYTIRNPVASSLNKIYHRLPVYEAVGNGPLTSVWINSSGLYSTFLVLILNVRRRDSASSHASL